MNRAKLYYLRKKVGKKARVRAKQYGGHVSSLGAPEAVVEEELEDVEPEADDEAESSPKPSRARAEAEAVESR